MNYDFSTVEDVDTFVTIPEGVYDCRIGAVRVGRSRDGHERWGLRLDVANGDYAGRVAAWDNLTWNEAGVKRIKYVLETFGLDVRGHVEVEPKDLEGCEVRAVLVLEEWEDPHTSRRQVRLKVPYRGYEPLDEEPLERSAEPFAGSPSEGAGSGPQRAASAAVGGD